MTRSEAVPKNSNGTKCNGNSVVKHLRTARHVSRVGHGNVASLGRSVPTCYFADNQSRRVGHTAYSGALGVSPRRVSRVPRQRGHAIGGNAPLTGDSTPYPFLSVNSVPSACRAVLSRRNEWRRKSDEGGW